jgi:hypothetical protein
VAESETGPEKSAAPGAEAPLLRCDTCGDLTATVSRVVIDHGYDRSNARPLWNCPKCYEKKDQLRRHQATGDRRQG